MKVTGLLRLLNSGGNLSVKTLLLPFLDNTATTTHIEGNLLTFRVRPRPVRPVLFNKLQDGKHEMVNLPDYFCLQTVPASCRKSPWLSCIFLAQNHRTLSCEAADRSQYSQTFSFHCSIRCNSAWVVKKSKNLTFKVFQRHSHVINHRNLSKITSYNIYYEYYVSSKKTKANLSVRKQLT